MLPGARIWLLGLFFDKLFCSVTFRSVIENSIVKPSFSRLLLALLCYIYNFLLLKVGAFQLLLRFLQYPKQKKQTQNLF